jgi:SNF2 family DNA or RNA helicase
MPKLDEAQEGDVQTLLANPRWGLFHEQGVGKTPPAIVAASRTPGRKLLTVPAYLIPQWEGFINAWVPGATVARMDGDGRKPRMAALHSDAEYVLTSYHNWTGKDTHGKGGWAYPFDQQRWGAFIFDEAHRLRGRNSQWTKRIYQLDNVGGKNKGAPMWFLTGTPMVRDAGDFFPFLHLCDRQLWTSYWRFVEEYCKVDVTPWETVIKGTKDPEALYKVIGMYSSRRELKLDTEPTFIDIPVELPMSVKQMITKAKKEFVFKHEDLPEEIWYESAGAVFGKCRQMTSMPPTKVNPKLDALKELVKEELPGQRIIIAAWFRDTANGIFELMKQLKRPAGLFTGDTKPRVKEEILAEYNRTDDFVIVCTIAALKEGANLQKGNKMIFVEEAELPADNAQLISRQQRRGQEKQVVVYRIFANGFSSDQAVHRMTTKRGEDVAKVMREYLSDFSS